VLKEQQRSMPGGVSAACRMRKSKYRRSLVINYINKMYWRESDIKNGNK